MKRSGSSLFALAYFWLLLTGSGASQPAAAQRNSQTPHRVGAYLQQVGHRWTADHGLPAGGVGSIVIAPAGQVFAGTPSGLFVLSDDAPLEQRRWTPVPGFEGRHIRRLALAGGWLVLQADEELLSTRLDSPNGVDPIARARSWGQAAGLRELVASSELQSSRLPSSGIQLWLAFDGRLQLRANGGDPSTLYELQGAPSALAVSPSGSRVAVSDSLGLLVGHRSPSGDFVWRRVIPKSDGRSWAPDQVLALLFDGEDHLWLAAPEGLARLRWSGEVEHLYGPREGLPFSDFTSLSAGPDRDLWAGTTKGLVHLGPKGWEYRQGLRWLPDDRVHAVAVDDRGQVWSATDGGVGLIERRSMTLEKKAQKFEQEIDRFHRRTEYGYIGGVELEVAGDRSRWIQHDSDNDGLWTSMYGAAQCFAYAVTGTPLAKERARAAFEALRFLGEVTRGSDHEPPHGFVARSILPASGRDPNVGLQERDRERRMNRDRRWKVLEPRWPKSADGRWYWKTDTSSDELDGHYFFYALYYDLVADEDERARVRETVAAITDHLIDHDFSLVDHDDRATRWAVFGPNALNHQKDWWEERGLNSLSILSYLRVAEHVCGNKRYGAIAHELIDDHGYAANVRVPKVHRGPGTGNQSDDEMAFMGFYNLLRYEKDDRLKMLWAHSFWRYQELVAPERNPLFNFLFAAVGAGERYTDAFEDEVLAPSTDWLEDSVDSLIRFPLDRVNWALDNSHRDDIVLLRESTTDRPRGHLVGGKVLPIDERYVEHWNHDPWALDSGGAGRRLGDGASFLLPYYLGRYYGFLEP